ncbi:YbbR-like domain-containing protein [Jejudonia soesokkakensis]|uniref:YbbR-like domain-containing protein n=1 Tax=Jejudonia soesokkakensis TaxID=1323432 RepID=A0ABW2MV11_9FLAO
MNPPSRKYKQTKLRTFFFFLLLAVVFWILTIFSKEYEATVQAKVVYSNLPQAVLLADDNMKSFSFDLAANGFEFLSYKLNEPVITFNITEYYSEGNEQIVISKEQLTRLVTAQLEKNLSVKNLSINELKINLHIIQVKKVPVIAIKEITYKEGYKSVKPMEVIPDSVALFGSRELLETIDSIATAKIRLENLENSSKGTIGLQLPNVDGLTVDPKEVAFKIKVEEFTQKQLLLPINRINFPPGQTIKLLPKTATVTFNVSLSDFNKITKEDFELVCDFSERNKEGNFIIPKLVKRPEQIRDVELDTKKVDFLIVK